MNQIASELADSRGENWLKRLATWVGGGLAVAQSAEIGYVEPTDLSEEHEIMALLEEDAETRRLLL